MKISVLFDVADRVAVVTGGASGIGYACAEVLAENGACVCLLDMDEDKLATAGARLSALTDKIFTAAVDAAEPTQMRAAIAKIHDRFGRLDVAFVNAGIGGGPGFLDMAGTRNPAGAIENLDPAIWHRHLRGNLATAFVGLQSVAPVMRAQRSGSIVVTTSVAAIKAENFVCTAYTAAKAGAAHLVRQVALELARDNVRVNAIAPGSFLTDIGNGRMADPAVRRRFAAANPMGRMADPGEIKGLALYLASDASSYMTGAQLVIDGGGSLGLAD